jgi:5-methylcytosine-specific restriction endonuclease McrA
MTSEEEDHITMLTRVENFSITLVPHVFSRRGHVRLDIGKRFWEWRKWRLTKEEFDQFLLERQSIPYRFQVDTKNYWLFEDKLYKDNEELTPEDVRALLITRQRLQRSRINRAKTIADSPATNREKASRTALPDDVKLLVWQRDLGRCVKYGSNSELQFDHIIPFSLGGASTPENLQILCGRCNRAKSNSIV